MRLTAKQLRRCAPATLGGALALLLASMTTSTTPDLAAATATPQPAATDSTALSQRNLSLTDADYEEVAAELDIPVAAIRAVVDIEAGVKGEGFNPDRTPIINFDLTMFRQAARRRGINLSNCSAGHPVVFQPLNRRKYGSVQAAQYARLHAALAIDSIAALEGTFWGMFQIGGFNWKLCGCKSVNEFVSLMQTSEREQLELFARFLRSRNLDRYIRNRQWAKFALRYNGPGYKKMRYDARMAAAFAKYSKESK